MENYLKLQKIVGNLIDKFPKFVHGWNGHLEIFVLASSNTKFVVKFASPNRLILYRKQSLGTPE